ncbi:uncharacterized protein LOC130566064 [Triplophysa rosa]|uniref:uncharacterized protein LOC130566064 n=1 Tax=Triplophysa rosa TaxID=992332 RepID=UPI002546045B|nr:uncharacterized protein LOC130566064 [Triplophysa rosa]
MDCVIVTNETYKKAVTEVDDLSVETEAELSTNIKLSQEAVAANGLQNKAKTLVCQLIRLSGRTLHDCLRDKIERRIVELAESSEEARRVLRLTMMKEMVRMYNIKLWQRKLIDVHKVIERFPSIFFILEANHPLWKTLDPENPPLIVVPSPGQHDQPPEAVMGNHLQKRAKALVQQLTRCSGPTLSKWCRNEAERKLIEFAVSSEEAHREVRMAIVEKMVQMHNSKRWRQKLIGVHKFIERFPSIFFIPESTHPVWKTLNPENPPLIVPPSTGQHAQLPPPEAVTAKGLQNKAKALVYQLIRFSGRTLPDCLR